MWPGRVPAGGRSNATVSALDVLPTFAALAGASLPSNRVLDGQDLGAVLFDGAPQLPTSQRPGGALFHPNSGSEGVIGELMTARMGPLKAKWLTGGPQTDCQGNTAPKQVHDPPLIFDLAADLAEVRVLWLVYAFALMARGCVGAPAAVYFGCSTHVSVVQLQLWREPSCACLSLID